MKDTERIPEIGLIGMSHKTASIDIREHFSLDDEAITGFIKKANARGVDEIVCVSTCNRVEIYFTSNDIARSVKELTTILEQMSSIEKNRFAPNIYKKYYKDAALHLFKVASSLDSMVVGENEILGQVKNAYRKSTSLKKTGPVLNRLFHQAFKTAKRVRTETEIARSPLSIAYIAAELAKGIFDDLSKRNALLIGAGEMGELILKYLTKFNINEITIANRSFHNAQKISDEINLNAKIITLEDIKNTAANADIIISSAVSNDYIITKEIARHAIKRRGNNPLFIIDIAVPRNIDPEIGKIDNIFLYNIDDLKMIAEKNLKSRIKEVEVAEALVESDAEKFNEWYESLAIVPAIVNIQKKFDAIRKNELNKYKKRKLKHLSKEDIQIIDNLTTQIMTKTLHDPIMYLKNFGNSKINREDVKESIKLIEKLFGK